MSHKYSFELYFWHNICLIKVFSLLFFWAKTQQEKYCISLCSHIPSWKPHPRLICKSLLHRKSKTYIKTKLLLSLKRKRLMHMNRSIFFDMWCRVRGYQKWKSLCFSVFLGDLMKWEGDTVCSFVLDGEGFEAVRVDEVLCYLSFSHLIYKCI